jgi:hypothetical protein
MDDGSPRTAHLGGTVLFLALMTGLVAAALLLVLAFRGSSQTTFVVGNATGVPCPVGAGVPACFSVAVTNAGGPAVRPRCVAHATPGTTALFGTGSSVYVSPFALDPGLGIELRIQVDTDGDVVLPPIVTCSPIG